MRPQTSHHVRKLDIIRLNICLGALSLMRRKMVKHNNKLRTASETPEDLEEEVGSRVCCLGRRESARRVRHDGRPWREKILVLTLRIILENVGK
jgi:hypothetical protein